MNISREYLEGLKDGHDQGYAAGYVDARKEIEDAASVWRRVTEELPRNGQLVVVIDDDGHANTAALSRKGGWWLSNSNNFFPMSRVLYWMPLPEPPMEVQE